jgi:hypothetical protein
MQARLGTPGRSLGIVAPMLIDRLALALVAIALGGCLFV